METLNSATERLVNNAEDNSPSATSWLQSVCDTQSLLFPELNFVIARASDDHTPILVITQRDLCNHPPLGYISRVVITILSQH